MRHGSGAGGILRGMDRQETRQIQFVNTNYSHSMFLHDGGLWRFLKAAAGLPQTVKFHCAGRAHLTRGGGHLR